MENEELTRRALAAWFRGGGIEQPSAASGVVEHEGLFYVRLEGTNGTLALYRVRTVNGEPMLKRMKRWPAALNA